MKSTNTTGFRMCPTNSVPQPQPVNKADYGRTMIDQYGRSYVQTPHGKIY